jgi:hypothetical protein
MSIRAINWAKHLGDCKELTSTMRHILLVLADFASDEDTAFPRQTIIAKITGLSRPTVNINLGYLQDIGLIIATGRKHANGGTRSSEYLLLIDDNPAVDQTLFYKDPDACPPFVPRVRFTNAPRVRDDDTGCSSDEQGGVSEPNRGCSSDEQGGVSEPDTLNHHLEPPPEPQARTAAPKKRRTSTWPDDYHEQFWSEWPKKVAKAIAMTKLNRVFREDKVEFTTIMDGVRRYVASCEELEFMMAPDKFIHGQRWDDQFDNKKSKKGPPSKRMAI